MKILQKQTAVLFLFCAAFLPGLTGCMEALSIGGTLATMGVTYLIMDGTEKEIINSNNDAIKNSNDALLEGMKQNTIDACLKEHHFSADSPGLCKLVVDKAYGNSGNITEGKKSVPNEEETSKGNFLKPDDTKCKTKNNAECAKAPSSASLPGEKG